MGFRLQQKSMTLDLNSLLYRQCCDQTAEARIMRFLL